MALTGMISETPRGRKPVAAAQAGVQTLPHWIPARAGMTRFRRPIVSHQVSGRSNRKLKASRSESGRLSKGIRRMVVDGYLAPLARWKVEEDFANLTPDSRI